MTSQAGNTPECFEAKVVTAHLILDHHVERYRGRALFVEAAQVEPLHVRTAVDELADGALVAGRRTGSAMGPAPSRRSITDWIRLHLGSWGLNSHFPVYGLPFSGFQN
jgi:hypothetical protein